MHSEVTIWPLTQGEGLPQVWGTGHVLCMVGVQYVSMQQNMSFRDTRIENFLRRIHPTVPFALTQCSASISSSLCSYVAASSLVTVSWD